MDARYAWRQIVSAGGTPLTATQKTFVLRVWQLPSLLPKDPFPINNLNDRVFQALSHSDLSPVPPSITSFLSESIQYVLGAGASGARANKDRATGRLSETMENLLNVSLARIPSPKSYFREKNWISNTPLLRKSIEKTFELYPWMIANSQTELRVGSGV